MEGREGPHPLPLAPKREEGEGSTGPLERRATPGYQPAWNTGLTRRSSEADLSESLRQGAPPCRHADFLPWGYAGSLKTHAAAGPGVRPTGAAG